MFGLDVDTQRNIREAIAQFPHIEKVLIYGSRAKGNYKAGSDIDITLIAEDLTLKNSVYPLSTALDELHLPYTFDISIFDQLENPDFVDHILRVGETFYQKENNVRKGWKEMTIGDVCDVRRGNTITRKSTKNGCVPVVAGGLSSPYTHNVANRPANTVTVSGSGANAGFVNFWDVPIYASDCSTVAAKEPNNLLSVFIYRFLQTQQNHIYKNLKRGAAQPHVYPKDIAKLIIPIPSLAEQKHIVAILDEALAAIATATANTKKNIANAKELFESYLGDAFDQITDCEDSTFGDEQLLAIVDGDRGSNYPKKSDFMNEGHCLFLNTGNVRPYGFEFSSTAFITKEKDDQLRKGKLKRGDVILTTRGTIGNIALYDESVTYDHVRINSGMLILRSNPTRISPYFLFEFLRSGIFKRQKDDAVSGAAQPQLPIKSLVKLRILLPRSLAAQTGIVNAVRLFHSSATELEKHYERKLIHLTELKQSLLHQAFTGALTADTNAADRSLSDAGV